MPSALTRAAESSYGYKLNADQTQYERVYLRGSAGTKRKGTDQRFRNIARVEAKRCMQRLAEKKHSTTAIGGAGIAATGVVNSLVIMSQGTSATSRTGNQVHLSLLSMCGNASLAAAAAGDLLRIIVGFDHEANGANPGVTDVLESAALTACYNRDKVGKRFTILSDTTRRLEQQAATITAPTIPLKLGRKLDKVVFYQSNAGTISDVLKENLFVIQISLNGLANTTLNAQICYTDL